MTNLPEATNLLSRVKVEPIKRPSEFYAAIVFEFSTVFFAAVAGYATRGNLLARGNFLWVVIACTAYLVLSTVLTLVTKNAQRRIAVLALESFVIVLFFYNLPIFSLAGIWMTLFAFSLWGEVATRAVYENSLHLKFTSVIRPQILKMITGFVIAFVILYPWYQPEALLPSKQLIATIVNGSSGIVGIFYPGIKSNATVDDIVRAAVETELANDQRFLALNPAERNQAISQSTQATEKRLADSFGFQVSGTTSAGDFFASVVNVKLGQYEQTLGSSFLLAWMVVVFFIVRSFAAFYYFVVAIVAYLLYEVLTAFDLIHLTSQSRTHEFIEFSQKS